MAAYPNDQSLTIYNHLTFLLTSQLLALCAEGKQKELAKEVLRFGEDLEVMLKAANHRYFGMNNKAPQEEVDNQIEDLIKMMMVSTAF